MRLFPKEVAAGRSYTELQQKKENEKAVGHKQIVADYKESLEQYGAEVHQIAENLEGLKGQQEDLQFLKEKQEYVLRNFPTLESNIVEKIKGAQANSTHELMQKLEEMERVQKKRNIWTKVLLWLSLICSMASVGGVVVSLLYLADVITF